MSYKYLNEIKSEEEKFVFNKNINKSNLEN